MTYPANPSSKHNPVQTTCASPPPRATPPHQHPNSRFHQPNRPIPIHHQKACPRHMPRLDLPPNATFQVHPTLPPPPPRPPPPTPHLTPKTHIQPQDPAARTSKLQLSNPIALGRLIWWGGGWHCCTKFGGAGGNEGRDWGARVCVGGWLELGSWERGPGYCGGEATPGMGPHN